MFKHLFLAGLLAVSVHAQDVNDLIQQAVTVFPVLLAEATVQTQFISKAARLKLKAIQHIARGSSEAIDQQRYIHSRLIQAAGRYLELINDLSSISPEAKIGQHAAWTMLAQDARAQQFLDQDLGTVHAWRESLSADLLAVVSQARESLKLIRALQAFGRNEYTTEQRRDLAQAITLWQLERMKM